MKPWQNIKGVWLECNTIFRRKLESIYQILSSSFINFEALHLKKYIMKKNMGTVDRVARILIAIVVAILFFTKVITGTLGMVLLVLAVIFVLTSLVSFCPLYVPFGIKTCKAKPVE
jgi:hypothetical protein